MSELYVSSENEKDNYPRYYRVMSEKLAKAQRILSKRKEGSVR
jgi:putative transposase